MDSRFKHGDHVAVDFGYSGKFGGSKVTGVHFTASKVRYDLEIITKKDYVDEPKTPAYDLVTRIYNVDSGFVMSRQEWLDLNQREPGIQTIKEDEVRISPFDHGGYFTSNDTPSPMSEGESYQVLIDLDGRRTNYSIGHYDFKHMMLTTLPIDTNRTLGGRFDYLKK
jgi:hypothetical protein